MVSIESATIDDSQYIEEFNKDSLFFGNPKENKINNITYFRIPIFRVLNNASGVGHKLLTIIIKSPNCWLRTGLKEFNNEGKKSHSMYFIFGKSNDEKDWIDQFKTKIVEPSIKRVVSSGAKLLRPEIKTNSDCFDCEKFAHIKFPHKKDEDGNKTEEIDENGNTMIIFKLKENNLGDCFTSFFKFNDESDNQDEPINLHELIEKKLEGKFELCVSSIFINKSVVSLQMKVSCACLRPFQTKVIKSMRLSEVVPKRKRNNEVLNEEEEEEENDGEVGDYEF